MKILALNLSTSAEKIGGAYIASELHTIHLNNLGVNIELWRMWSCDLEQIKYGLKIRSFKSKSILNVFTKFLPKKLISIFLYSNISKELIRYEPDIVHIHNILPSFELLRICKICKKYNIKTVISTHGFYECFNPSFKYSFIEQYMWKLLVTNPVKKAIILIDSFMSLYPLEAKLLKKNKVPRSKIYLVPNGVNSFYEEKPKKNEINNVISKYKIDIHTPILFFTGNHTANKGLDTIKVICQSINIKVNIIIGGRLKDKNEPKLFTQGINNKYVNIIFTDFLPIVDQRSLYNLSSLLLFPSKSDTLPLTIIEAMACGLPVIAFDIGGINFLLQDDCGYLIKSNDVEGYIKKIIAILSNPEDLKSKSLNALNRQKRIFSWTKAAEKAIAIYENMID
tara:strand:+ start:160 stop:1344 length:1185 start_codon:yes stop_codon:yes gene_type:complete